MPSGFSVLGIVLFVVLCVLQFVSMEVFGLELLCLGVWGGRHVEERGGENVDMPRLSQTFVHITVFLCVASVCVRMHSFTGIDLALLGGRI